MLTLRPSGGPRRALSATVHPAEALTFSENRLPGSLASPLGAQPSATLYHAPPRAGLARRPDPRHSPRAIVTDGKSSTRAPDLAFRPSNAARSQAAALRRFLKKQSDRVPISVPELIVVSPLMRTLETAVGCVPSCTRPLRAAVVLRSPPETGQV